MPLAYPNDPVAVVVFNTQSGSYTLVITDANKLIRMNVASANNLTVPPNSSVPFEIGTVIQIAQVGAGQTTLVQGSGVIINKPASQSLAILERYGMVTIIKDATDTWIASGLLA